MKFDANTCSLVSHDDDKGWYLAKINICRIDVGISNVKYKFMSH